MKDGRISQEHPVTVATPVLSCLLLAHLDARPGSASDHISIPRERPMAVSSLSLF